MLKFTHKTNTPDNHRRPMKPRDLVLPHFKAHWRMIAAGLVALMGVDLMQLMIPRVIKWAVDDLTAFEADTAALIRYAGILAAMALVIGVLRYLWRRALLGMARRLEEQLRNRLLGHLQNLSAGYFDQVKTGDLMAHATNDIQQVRMAAGMGLVAFNDAVVLGAASIGFMLYIHPVLTLYVLIPMPLIVLSTRLLGRRMHKRYKNVQAAFADLTETVRERCAGIRMIKAHHGEADAEGAVQSVSQNYINENIKLVGVTGLFFPMMLLLTNLSLAMVLYFGGRRTILAEITTGDFVAFISYLNLLAWPMMALGWVTNLMQRGGASLARLKVILERQSEIVDAPGARPLSRIRGDIRFDKLTFAYNGRPVLEDIDFGIAHGEMLGVVGPPGSGKSTLLNLVPRFYDPQKGRVTLDQFDVREVALSDLRRRIAYVPQEPFLFAATVRENLLFGTPEASPGQITRAIEDAALTETLAALPEGLDTLVGEKGVLLSGGQKQRIALARALLTDAKLMLLDDPISQVDTATGEHIIRAIGRQAGTKTIIIVSHRLAAVRRADLILSLESGRIAESGSHKRLLSGNGYYARVHALQELEDAI